MGAARYNFFKKSDGTLTEEEKEIRRLYGELDEKYKEESIAMKNYKEYEAWCKEHHRLPRKGISINGKNVIAAKKGEQETEEQVEQRLGKVRNTFFKKSDGTLTEEEKEIRKLYKNLVEQYGKRQPAKNIALAIKNVPIGNAQEAEEFMQTITNEKDKKGVNHNDE